jgi:hypothetical protein
MENRKVFITNLAQVDYSKLDKFGETVVMTHGFVDMSDLSEFYQRVRKFLETSSPDDYLALSGSCAVSVAIAMFWLNSHGQARLLSWNRKSGNTGDYQEIILTRVDLIPDGKEEIHSGDR